MRNLKTKLLVVGMLTGSAACTTVPEDAPEAFLDAQSSVEKMDEKDVDDVMPMTVERAETNFEEALEMLEEANEENDILRRTASIDKARKVEKNANNAIEINEKIEAWDKNAENLQAGVDSLTDADVELTTIQPVAVSPLHKLQGTKILSTVAYFDTNKAEGARINKKELESLASILKKDRRFKVNIMGYTGVRGEKAYNKNLAMQRAQTVAKMLINDYGVNKNQVRTKAEGESNALAEAGNPKKLQLDRSVKAQLVLM